MIQVKNFLKCVTKKFDNSYSVKESNYTASSKWIMKVNSVVAKTYPIACGYRVEKHDIIIGNHNS